MRCKNANMRSRFFRLLVISFICLMVYNEFLTYFLSRFHWPQPPYCENCTVILFVSDPQLLGENKEGFLARWDSDKFLKMTFSLVLNYVDPDAIVFLGDLMDEGEEADAQQFQRYFKRFEDIFQMDYLIAKLQNNIVFVPGDNDVGGEPPKYVIRSIPVENVLRFQQYFPPKDLISVKNMDIISVNKLLCTLPNVKTDEWGRRFKIVVSHLPITISTIDDYEAKMWELIKPDLIVSGHGHFPFYEVTLSKTNSLVYSSRVMDTGANIDVHLENIPSFAGSKTAREVGVPTCSYRMGVSKYGYAALHYDANSESFSYYIYWSPSRFSAFSSYILFVTCSILISIYIKKL